MPLPRNDFLTDYSGPAAAGSAFQGFAQGLQDAQDRALKRQELQARMQSMQAEQDRQAQELAISKRIHGLQDAPGGGLEEVPMGPREIQAQKIGMAEKGLNQTPDQNGNYSFDPNSPQMITAKAHMKAAQMGGIKFGTTENDKTNTDFEKFATTIDNPSSRAQLGRYQQNIDNANKVRVLLGQLGMPAGQTAPPNETRAQKIARYNAATPQQLYEIASANDNLVSSGNGTVFGKEHLLPPMLSTASANFGQWGTSKPKPTNAGEIIANYADTVEREGGYMQQQRDKAVSGVASGFKHLRAKDPQRYEEILGSTTGPGLVPTQGLVAPGLVSPQVGAGAGRAPQTPQNAQPQDYPIGTKARTKSGQNVVYKGNGVWASQ